MQADQFNDNARTPAIAEPTREELLSGEALGGQTLSGPMIAGQTLAGQSVSGTNLPAASELIGEVTVKVCCICGLDVTQKKRSRDRSGRYWCAHCHGFIPAAEKTPGVTPCPDCGRETRQTLLVEQNGVRVCSACNQLYLAEAEPRRARKLTVTANPELEIHALIGKMVKGIIGLAAVGVLVTLYHFGLLYVHPMGWVPFLSALYFLGIVAVGVGIAIGIQYLRMAYRKRKREAEYDKMIQSLANQILATDDESHAMGISESPEPLRRRVERAIGRVEACAGQGKSAAGEILETLARKGDPEPLIHFLMALRPKTADTIGRNREIATISYLHGDFPIATSVVTAILLRLHYDQEAMTRQALICFRTGELEQSKKIFKRVVHTAKEKKSELDLAEAYSNLGMLHMMLSEFDDAANRYSQAMTIYKRLDREEGQADCLLSLGLIAFKKKQPLEAEDRFRNAMAINNRRNRHEGLSVCCSLLGVILFEKEPPELKEAEKLLNRAIELNIELGRPGGVAAAHGNLGLVRAKRGDLKGAREELLKAQSIYQRINRPKMMVKIQGMLKTVGTMSAARAARK
jgi:tetratricopeptide (TPR) repeat protein